MPDNVDAAALLPLSYPAAGSRYVPPSAAGGGSDVCREVGTAAGDQNPERSGPGQLGEWKRLAPVYASRCNGTRKDQIPDYRDRHNFTFRLIV
jgi:hypothetical protein